MLSGVSVPLRVGGSEVFEVDLSTLAAAPEGSYFRALLSFYDLEGHADSATAQQTLQEVLSRCVWGTRAEWLPSCDSQLPAASAQSMRAPVPASLVTPPPANTRRLQE